MHLWSLGLGTLPDHVILARAREDSRILLTADLDFGLLMAAGGHSLPSVILFRLRDMTPASVGDMLSRVLADHAIDLLKGMFVVVTESAIRARPLPIGGDE